MRILVVDDTPSVRKRLVAMIAAIPGVRSVLQASDGADGLALAFAELPDVLVVDIRMPRMNGFQVLAALDGDAVAPIRMVVSNHADYRTHALLVGATHFFDKSTQLDDLVATLSNLADAMGRAC